MWKNVDPVAFIISLSIFIFGYGVLSSRVDALEKKEVTVESSLITINNNITQIKEDVSFIKGKLEKE